MTLSECNLTLFTLNQKDNLRLFRNYLVIFTSDHVGLYVEPEPSTAFVFPFDLTRALKSDCTNRH